MKDITLTQVKDAECRLSIAATAARMYLNNPNSSIPIETLFQDLKCSIAIEEVLFTDEDFRYFYCGYDPIIKRFFVSFDGKRWSYAHHIPDMVLSTKK
jgi:hypothetical protein